MSAEFAGEPDFETLRRIELEQRERRRIARESGEIPGLRARRRAVLPVAVAAPVPTPAPVEVPARIATILDRVAEQVGEPNLFAKALASADRRTDPLSVIAETMREHVSGLAPLIALGHVADLTAAGVPLLSENAWERAEAVLTARLPGPPMDPMHLDAWQLHLEATEAAGTPAALSTEAWQRLVHALPLPIVDDLIDNGTLSEKVHPADWPDRDARTRYVVARLAPDKLDDHDVEALEWTDEARRRVVASNTTIALINGRHDQWSLRAALLEGEITALDHVQSFADEDFPFEVAQLVRALQAIRRGTPVERQLGNDRGLFGVLEDCVPQDRLISGRTAFHYWAGTRRMYRLLDEAHWAMAAEPVTAPDVLRGVIQQATALRNEQDSATAGRADREARAVIAYVYFLTARPGDRDRLDQGVGLLEEILKRGAGRRTGVDRESRRRMNRLSQLLQALRHKSKPHDVLNPYLALSVEHGSTEWPHGWRNLRTQVPTEQLEYINAAKDRIRRLETARRLGNEAEELYELPLDKRFLWVPRDQSPLLQPRAHPLERRTDASTPEDQQWTASEAAREIIDRAPEQ
ncbi:hypothetical protein OG607_32865 [Streptomyces sp. NBC_01537]|uniref:hypothetical protein n=1 Tax=Streptomyces sp. NBC_01537 TaxID=2903896 RepID=UPI00386FEB13